MRFFTLLLAFITSCSTIDLYNDYPALYSDGYINAVIEIPAGTLQKWEYNKSGKKMVWDRKDGKPRVINYLSYPGNYGMIPKTILPKEIGGDGDPLDVIVLGESVPRGIVVKAKLIGVIKLLDRGEQDDKLIAVAENSPLFHINSLNELDNQYAGISEILKIWFENYKGKGKIIFQGFGNKKQAQKILKSAINSFKND